MSGSFATVTHTIANFQVRHCRMFVDDYSRARVSEHSVLAKLRADFSRGPDRTFILHHVPNHAHVTWILANFLDQPFVVNACRFGAAADQ